MGVHEREFDEFKRHHVRRSTCIMLMILALMAGAFIGNVVTSLMFEQRQHAVSTGMPAGSPQTAPELATLEAAATSHPDDPHAWSALGNYYFDHDMPSRAVEAYEKSLALGPNHPGVWSDLGVMYRRTGRFEKAVEAFDQATALDPKLTVARFNKGIVLLHDLDKKEEALAVWRAILAMDPAATAPDGRSLDEVIREAEAK
ncbi:tetratricopeptide repeat protein [Salidesulfovibrio onnuriiensis]|uniref:tetratricopeptide repeat protein n=1 Tax=Salidesulfovibrio onnuriiensis TaxID=2583823 RepID=UPI0011CAD816|nr:tetratricopeptide repeat protein [Salidesulfovibrio onnuriiensis]